MNDFIKQSRNGVEYYTIPLLNSGKVITAFTTRHGGVSTGHLASMNMSYTRGDEEKNVHENYMRLADALAIDKDKFAFSYQVHQNDVHEVDENNFGISYEKTKELMKADALVTNKKGVTLVKHSADCTIVYFYDPVHEAIGLAHSGWRSTVLNVVGKTIDKMKKLYNTDPSDLICAISPTIMECCFEVGEEVADIFEKVFKPEDNTVSYDYEKSHINLVNACKSQLINAGVKSKNIAYAGLCSCCRSDEFFSHRKTKGNCGLSIGTISLL
ncbi:MAG: peptidoglycan editing factor PgeF [Eubacteriales bacterium]